MLSEMFGERTAGMLICSMFATRLSWAVCGMYREVLMVVLPVVPSSTGVVQEDESDQKFPRLPWTATAAGWVNGGRGTIHGSYFNGDITMGVHQHSTCKLLYSHVPTCATRIWGLVWSRSLIPSSQQFQLFKFACSYWLPLRWTVSWQNFFLKLIYISSFSDFMTCTRLD